MTTKNFKWAGLVAGVLFAFGASASLPKLPQALQLPQSVDSPGVVTFNHESHVDAKKPQCATCHPRLFSILGRSAEKRVRIVKHEAMEKGGESCGACHGKTAFNFEDCTTCHAQ
jgi:c(7)-type cytochrome triheme protein